MILNADGHEVAALVCSAKGCRNDAVWALQWNNPKLHEPERRKTWLACDAHRESLAQFLSMRDFLREVVPAESLGRARRDDSARGRVASAQESPEPVQP